MFLDNCTNFKLCIFLFYDYIIWILSRCMCSKCFKLFAKKKIISSLNFVEIFRNRINNLIFGIL